MIRQLLFTCVFFAVLIFVDRYLTLIIGMIVCGLFSYYGTKIVVGNWEKIMSVSVRVSDTLPILDGTDGRNSSLSVSEFNNAGSRYQPIEGIYATHSAILSTERDEFAQETEEKITDRNERTFNPSHCGTVLSHNEEIRTFICKISCHYLQTWYKNISQNEDTADEFNTVLKEILETAYNNVSTICILDVIEKIIHLYSQHFHHYLQALDFVKRQYDHASVKACIGMESEIHTAYKMSHPAMADETTEWCYLRGIMATIIDLLWPQEFLGCHAPYIMLEEILSKNVLFSLVNLLSDPAWLNQMIILLLSDSPIHVEKFCGNKHSEENISKENVSISKKSEKSKIICASVHTCEEHECSISSEIPMCSHSVDRPVNCIHIRRHSDYEPKHHKKLFKLSLEEKCQSSTTDIFFNFQTMPQHFGDVHSSYEQQSLESDWEIWSNEVPSKRNLLGISCYSNLSRMRSLSSQDIDNFSTIKNEYGGENKESQENDLKKCQSVDCLSELNPLSPLVSISSTNYSNLPKLVTLDIPLSKMRNICIDVEEAQEATEVAWLDLFSDVQIVETEIQEETGKGTYLLYCIQYSAVFLNKEEENHAQFVRNNVLVKRRFREFLALQSRLEDNPKLKKYMKKVKAPNKSIGSLFTPLDKKIVEERKQFLESYLQQLCSCKAISVSSELQEFLAYGGDASIAYVRKVNDIGVPRIDKMLLKGVKGAIDLIKTALPNIPQDDNSEKSAPVFSTKGIQSKSSFLPVFGKSKHDNHQHPVEVKYIGYNDSHLTQRLTEYIENFDINSSEGSIDVRNDLSHRRVQVFERTDSTSSIDIPLTFQHENRPETILKDQENFQQSFQIKIPLANAVLDLYLKSIKIFLPFLGNSIVTRILKASLGYYFDRWLTKRITKLFSYKNCVNYLHILHLSLWPEEVETLHKIEKREIPEENKLQRDAAFIALKLFLPGVLSKIIGKETFEDSMLLLHDSLQYSKLNRCLVYHILDQLIDHLCSEENRHIN